MPRPTRLLWPLAAALAAVLHAAPPSSPRSAALPRTPWGQPDIQGRWTNATITPLERPVELGSKEFFSPAEAKEYAKTALQKYLAQANQAEEAEIAGESLPELWGEDRGMVSTRRTSLIVGPTGRLPPLTAAAQQRAAARAAARSPGSADSPEERPLNERCLWFPVDGPPMLPSVTYNSNYEIVQTPDSVVIHIELGEGLRIIRLDGRQHAPSRIRSWLGDSVGHWEGDTLVVDTTNFSEKRELRGSSSTLHLVERFRRVSADVLLYSFTADDPNTWTAPWSAEVPMRPLDGLLYEYACHEGNRSLAYVLQGARAAERRLEQR